LLTEFAVGGKNSCPQMPTIRCAQAQSDLRVLFDPYRKRFWVLDGGGIYTADRDPKKTRGIWLVGVSKSEDPKDGWYLYWMDVVAHWGQANDTVYKPGYVAAATDIRPSWPLKPGDGTYQSAGTTCKDKNGNTVVNKYGNPVYCPVRWGDTAGAALDPTDETGIWVAQQYANATGGWDIWVGKVFGPKPGP
jgi:hypothetical protein